MMWNFHVGLGFDSHAFAEGRSLILGGVEIPHEKGLAGHSDADALTHAVIDAVLGAAGEPDIGELFPDTDESWRGANSLKLLALVVRKVGSNGWQVVNVDATVICDSPKLSPHKRTIIERMAPVLGVGEDCVNIKGKTTEGTNSSGEGISVHAVVLLRKDEV